MPVFRTAISWVPFAEWLSAGGPFLDHVAVDMKQSMKLCGCEVGEKDSKDVINKLLGGCQDVA